MSVAPHKLLELAEPFPPNDIKWRVLRADLDRDDKPFAIVFAYISKRAMQQRLDDVCGPENWCNTSLQVTQVQKDDFAMQVGISINIDGHWVTKFDVSQCTDIEPVKGGFSTASKRAASQWGIGRYLEHIGQIRVSLSKTKSGDGIYLFLKKTDTGYFWIPPKLPGWAMPRIRPDAQPANSVDAALESSVAVTTKDRDSLYFAWKNKFQPLQKDRAVAREAFDEWVFDIVGKFPIGDIQCWTQPMVSECKKRLAATTDPKGPSADVPFGK